MIPEIPRCAICKRISEVHVDDETSGLNGKSLCDECMDTYIRPEGFWVYRTPFGEYWIAGQETPDWGEPFLAAAPFREAWTLVNQLANQE